MALFRFIKTKPRIVLFAGKNMVSLQILNFLNNRKDLIIHVFNERDEITRDIVASYHPDVIITCYWPYLLKPEIFEIPMYGCINFHPSLLPENRGWYPVVWEILSLEQRAGVTLHLIDKGADTGPIIAQREFPVKETDTGETLYGRSQLQMIELFEETWPKLFNPGVELTEQDPKLATYHSKEDASHYDEIDVDQMYVASYLIDLIRAKTFKHKGYAYYYKDGKKYRIQIKITEENE